VVDHSSIRRESQLAWGTCALSIHKYSLVLHLLFLHGGVKSGDRRSYPEGSRSGSQSIASWRHSSATSSYSLTAATLAGWRGVGTQEGACRSSDERAIECVVAGPARRRLYCAADSTHAACRTQFSRVRSADQEVVPSAAYRQAVGFAVGFAAGCRSLLRRCPHPHGVTPTLHNTQRRSGERGLSTAWESPDPHQSHIQIPHPFAIQTSDRRFRRPFATTTIPMLPTRTGPRTLQRLELQSRGREAFLVYPTSDRGLASTVVFRRLLRRPISSSGIGGSREDGTHIVCALSVRRGRPASPSQSWRRADIRAGYAGRREIKRSLSAVTECILHSCGRATVSH
jgi:hypothetical protein